MDHKFKWTLFILFVLYMSHNINFTSCHNHDDHDERFDEEQDPALENFTVNSFLTEIWNHHNAARWVYGLGPLKLSKRVPDCFCQGMGSMVIWILWIGVFSAHMSNKNRTAEARFFRRIKQTFSENHWQLDDPTLVNDAIRAAKMCIFDPSGWFPQETDKKEPFCPAGNRFCNFARPSVTHMGCGYKFAPKESNPTKKPQATIVCMYTPGFDSDDKIPFPEKVPGRSPEQYQMKNLTKKQIYMLHRSNHPVSVYQRLLFEFLLTMSKKPVNLDVLFDMGPENASTTTTPKPNENPFKFLVPRTLIELFH